MKYDSKQDLDPQACKKHLLCGLEILGTNGVDIKTLVIWCNPNRIRGPDYQVKERILSILEKLVAEKKVAAKRKSPKKNDILFLLVKTKNG